MSQSAIAKIKEAEEQAEVLCRVAEERAAEMIAGMESKAKAHLAEVERTAVAQREEKLTQTKALTQALVDKKRQEAEQQARDAEAAAREHMDEAVRAIVWGIVENVSM
jgi:vacuolar-type H+-ATPase subunit H